MFAKLNASLSLLNANHFEFKYDRFIWSVKHEHHQIKRITEIQGMNSERKGIEMENDNNNTCLLCFNSNQNKQKYWNELNEGGADRGPSAISFAIEML